METIDMTGFQGGGATRKTGSCCGLQKRHSGPDPESINADKDRLRLGGRSDDGNRTPHTKSRHSDKSQSLSMPVNSICHPELVSESQNKEIDSGSEAGMTKPLPVYLPCHSELDSESINVDNRLRLAGRSDQLSRKAAFTMAEVLITLGIIGIVAAMTLPTVINRAQRKILAQQFKKSYATVQNAINLAQSEWGAPYECYNTGFGGYHLDECEAFWDAFLKNVKVIQKCDGDDYDCHPKYKTKSEVLAEGGEVINNSCSMNFSYANFYILNDGTYIMIKNDNPGVSHHQVYFLIDVNGKRGPNKWGYDLYYLTLNREDLKKDVIVANEVCAMKEKGGMYINEMLLE